MLRENPDGIFKFLPQRRCDTYFQKHAQVLLDITLLYQGNTEMVWLAKYNELPPTVMQLTDNFFVSEKFKTQTNFSSVLSLGFSG